MEQETFVLDGNSLKESFSFTDTQVAFGYKTDTDLWKAYLLFSSINRNWLVNSGTSVIKFALKVGLPVDSVLKTTLFKQFCGGENIEDCSKTIDLLARYHVGTILDYSVEGEKTEAAFDATERETILTVRKAAQNPQAIPFSVFKVTGLAPFSLLEKITASLRNEAMPLLPSVQAEYEKLKTRVDNICKEAHQHNVRIFIDAEETWIQDAIDELAYQMMAKYNKEKVIVYNTYQMYTQAGIEKLRYAKLLAVKNMFYVGAKIVRGAYMEKERARAKANQYPDPIQPNKRTTDQAYDEALRFCIDNKQRFDICAGTHNENSCYYLALLMEKYNIKKNDQGVWFAQLYGMSDHISFNLAKAGYNVAKYVPYGPVKAVMPYLFRRAAENTSVAGQSSRELSLVERELARRKRAKGKIA